MTIRPGEEWGIAVDRPASLHLCATDEEFVRRSIAGDGPLAVTSGDLHRSVGAATVRDVVQRVEVDGLSVTLDDGARYSAVAHVVMRRHWSVGRVAMVMNVDYLGEWNVAPRAHPNDGRFDVCEVAPSMSIRQRWAARTRLVTGTHVPHPQIATSTHRERVWEFDRPLGVWVDGVRVGSSKRVSVEVEPDAYTLHI